MRFGKIVAVGASLIGASAFAQSSVTLYGLIDAGVEYVSHANSAGDHLVRMPGGGEYLSRWGFRGSEDLGGGLHAIFTLENGFNTRGGDLGQGGRLFGRQAWVGIDGRWGALTFGRQYNMASWVLSDAEILAPDTNGIGALDNYLPSARSDNTVAYKGTFKGLTLGATYSLGRDSTGTGNSPGQGTCAGQVAGDYSQCKDWSAMIKYDSATFGLATAYDEQRGGKGAAANFFNGVAPFPIASGSDKDARLQANGYVNIAPFKIGGGWLGRRVQSDSPAIHDVRSNLFYLGVEYFAAPDVSVDAEAFRIIISQQDARATMAALRATYFLSKATAVYVKGAYLWNSAHAAFSATAGGGGTTPAKGTGQFATMIGIRKFF
jgi:predicted porin